MTKAPNSGSDEREADREVVAPDPLDSGAEDASEIESDLGGGPIGVDAGWEDEPGPGRAAGGLSDMVRKAMVAGLGAVFMTEEGIRTLVKDLKLPKDLMGYLVSQADRSKSELMRVVSQELRRFFESAALRGELARLLSDVVIEVKAEIRLRPDGSSPEVKVGTTTRRHRR